MSSCKTNECQRQPLLALYDKISRLKSLDRILINTGSNFKAKSPQKSPDIRAILDHSKLSIERSKSSKAIDQQLNHQKRDQKNDIRKEGQLLQLYLMCMHNSLQNQRLVINLQKKAKIIEPISVFNFLSQPLYNRTSDLIKIIIDKQINQFSLIKSEVSVHQILNLNSLIPINPNLKANINFQDINKNSALHYAVLNENVSLVQALIFKQIQIDIVNSEHITPFMLACIHGHKDIILILYEEGADINHSDNKGDTSLHYACRFNQKEVVECLLKMNGIQIRKNNEQKIPESYTNQLEIQKLFQNYHLSTKGKRSSNSEKRTKEIKIQNILTEYLKKSKKCESKGTSTPLVKLQNELKQQSVNQQTNQLNQLLINTSSTIDSLKQSKSKVDERVGPQQFQLVGLLGRGSFGEVYLVQRQQKLYAMKVLRKSLIFKQNICRYAITERNVLSVSSHPFIVKLRYAFQTQDKLFMILDYCPGGDLGQILTKQKRLSENIVKLYMCEIILALEDLHKRDILFRDLKPDNIVLDSEGHALITDFGLSKEGIFDADRGAQSFCGSVAYLAPEMLQRQGHGKALDWYLLGVVMYELLTGLPPFYSDDKDVLFNNIQNGELQIPNYISVEGKNLLKALLNRNPVSRLGSGEGDYLEVKQHPYFHDINWDKVLNRELKMPKPTNNKVYMISKGAQNVFDLQSFIEIEKSHVDGWSYIHTE